MTANATVSLTIRLRDAVSAPARAVKNSFKQIGEDLKKLQGGFDLAGKVGLAASAVNQLGQQTRGILTSVLDPAIRFEDTMARVGALTSDISEDNLKKLNEKARELGRNTRFMGQQVGEGFQQLAIAGYDTEAQLTSIEPILKLTQAAGSDLGRTADIVSDLMGGFGKSAKDTGEITGVLAATFSNSTTTLETLYETMKYAAPVATDLGISMQQTAVLTGLLGNAGVKGSMAGTSLRQMMLSLTKPSKDAQRALHRVGLRGKDLAKYLDKPADLLRKIFNSFNEKNLSRAERLKVLNQIFGQRAVTSASVLLKAASAVGKDGVNAFDKLFEAVNNGEMSLDRLAKIMGSTNLAAILRLQSAIESLKLDISDKLAPAFGPLIEDVTKLISRFSVWAKQNPDLVLNIGKLLLGVTAFAAVFGPLLLTLSSLISVFTVLRGAWIIGFGPTRSVTAGLEALNSQLNKGTYAMENMGGATRKAGKLLRGLKNLAGVGTAFWLGWEFGEWLDKQIPKWLGMAEKHFHEWIAKKLVANAGFNKAIYTLGKTFGIKEFQEIGMRNLTARDESVADARESVDEALRDELPSESEFFKPETPVMTFAYERKQKAAAEREEQKAVIQTLLQQLKDAKVKVDIEILDGGTRARVKSIKSGKGVATGANF